MPSSCNGKLRAVGATLWPRFRRFRGFKRFRGWWYRPAGDAYKVSVTGLAFCIIWHDKHSADWLAALASPYPAAPDFHLKVKRLTMICASLALLHPLLSLTHWIFRSLMLPYKSSSHSANHVRCASTGKRVTRFSGRFAPLQHGYHRLTIFCASLRSFKICSLV